MAIRIQCLTHCSGCCKIIGRRRFTDSYLVIALFTFHPYLRRISANHGGGIMCYHKQSHFVNQPYMSTPILKWPSTLIFHMQSNVWNYTCTECVCQLATIYLEKKDRSDLSRLFLLHRVLAPGRWVIRRWADNSGWWFNPKQKNKNSCLMVYS